MKNKLEELLKLDESIYVDKKSLKGNFTKTNSIRINANIKEEELENFDFKSSLENKKYIIIDMDASNEVHQRKFLSIIKDKKYKSLSFDKLKIIVTSTDINSISNEVLGLLVIL